MHFKTSYIFFYPNMTEIHYIHVSSMNFMCRNFYSVYKSIKFFASVFFPATKTTQSEPENIFVL